MLNKIFFLSLKKMRKTTTVLFSFGFFFFCNETIRKLTRDKVPRQMEVCPLAHLLFSDVHSGHNGCVTSTGTQTDRTHCSERALEPPNRVGPPSAVRQTSRAALWDYLVDKNVSQICNFLQLCKVVFAPTGDGSSFLHPIFARITTIFFLLRQNGNYLTHNCCLL